MTSIKEIFKNLTRRMNEVPLFSIERISKDTIRVSIENRKGKDVEVYKSDTVDGEYTYIGIMKNDVLYLSTAKKIKLSFVNGMKSLAKYL